MDKKDIKNFKITSLKPNKETEKYLFKFRGDSTTEWSRKLFYLYARSKWPNFEYELNDEYSLTEQKLKENKAKYLELVKNFISDIKFNDKHYYFDSFKIKEPTHFMGYHNREYFYAEKDDIISIISPSFKDVDLKLKYYFEKEFCDANFYLNNYIWVLNKPNPYLNDKEFVKELESVVKKAPEKLNLVNNQTLKAELVIKPVIEHINFLPNEEMKTKLLAKANDNLTFTEYEKMESFVSMIKKINKLKDPNVYNNSVIYDFKDYLNKNEYLKKTYINSISKEELVELLNYKENNETDKSRDLKKQLLYRFLTNHSKEITDLFLENSISNKSKQILEEIELERD